MVAFGTCLDLTATACASTHARKTLGFSQGIVGYPTALERESETPFPAKPGDLLVHDAMTIHRADGNRSMTRSRRARLDSSTTARGLVKTPRLMPRINADSPKKCNHKEKYRMAPRILKYLCVFGFTLLPLSLLEGSELLVEVGEPVGIAVGL